VLTVADDIMMMPVLAFPCPTPPLKSRHKECFQVFETDCREIPQKMKFFSKRENTLSCGGGGCYQWRHWQCRADRATSTGGTRLRGMCPYRMFSYYIASRIHRGWGVAKFEPERTRDESARVSALAAA